jgi:hypothetical protein
MKAYIRTRVWKKKGGWSARTYVLYAVHGNKTKAQAIKDLNNFVCQSSGCPKAGCFCPPMEVGMMKKKQARKKSLWERLKHFVGGCVGPYHSPGRSRCRYCHKLYEHEDMGGALS